MPQVTAHAQINLSWDMAGIFSWCVEHGWNMLMACVIWQEYAHGYRTISQAYRRTTTISQP